MPRLESGSLGTEVTLVVTTNLHNSYRMWMFPSWSLHFNTKMCVRLCESVFCLYLVLICKRNSLYREFNLNFQINKYMWTWGLFDRASSSWRKVVCTVRMVPCRSRHHPHRTHDLRSGSQDHHSSKNSVHKTMCCNSTSNAPDDGLMYPKHVELRIHQ